MNTLTITLNDTRQIDGLIYAANSASMSVEDFALLILSKEGKRFADTGFIGRETSSAFIQRFTAAEYGAVLAACAQDLAVEPDPADPTYDAVVAANAQLTALKQYVEALTSVPYVHWDDPRLAPGLALLESAGLIAAGRAAEILTYERPTPEVV